MNSTKTQHDLAEVGVDATLGVGSDRYPYRVMAVNDTRKTIWVARLGYRGVEGHNNAYTEDQRYEYFESMNMHNPDFWECYTLRKDGRYRAKGQSLKSRPIHLGYASYYCDPHF